MDWILIGLLVAIVVVNIATVLVNLATYRDLQRRKG